MVSEQIGHSTVRFTPDGFTHLLPDSQRKAARQVDAILFGKEETKKAPQSKLTEAPLFAVSAPLAD